MRLINVDDIDFRIPYFTDGDGEIFVSLSDVRHVIAKTPTADVVQKSEVAKKIADNIIRLSEECGGGVLFYHRMRQYAEELKNLDGDADENNN